MFSYEHLSSFCATVEEGSYAQAAKKIGKDRTTVREQIKALEDSYAVELFEIHGKRAHVTPIGETVYRQAKLLVKNSERLDSKLMRSYLTPFTKIDIFHDVLTPTPVILHVEQYMSQHHPDIKLNWLHRSRDEALIAVSESTDKLALMQYKLSSHAQYPTGYMNLGNCDIDVYCGADHPLTKLDSVSVQNLQTEKQYVSENLVETLPELFNVSSDVRVVSNSDVLIELVKKDGWAAMNRTSAEPWVEQGKLVRLEIEELATSLQAGVSFFYSESTRSTKEISGLIDSLKHFVQNGYS